MSAGTRSAGAVLVVAQFSLIAWLVWPLTTQVWSIPALVLAGAAAWLGAWTLAHNRPGNFNIRPEVKAGAGLVTSGPYRWVRHPMYSAVLLFGAAEAVAYSDPWKLAAWCLLLAVLLGKAAMEERGLAAQFPEYADYEKRVRRFMPGLF